MFIILESFSVEYGYTVVFFVLVICGFDVPIPEDLMLITGGVTFSLDCTNLYAMLVIGMFGVLVGDGFMFAAGRIQGQKTLKFRPAVRVMTPKRYVQVQEELDKYGNWVLFATRSPPGLYTAVLVTADIGRKVSYLRFALMDGLAILISVPVWIYLGEYGARNTDWLTKKVHSLQPGIFIVLGIDAVIVGWVQWKKYRRHAFFHEKLREKRAAKARKQTNQ